MIARLTKQFQTLTIPLSCNTVQLNLTAWLMMWIF